MKYMDTKDMQVLVLMGGMGTRLGELAAERPKAMMPVNGKPFFRYQFDLMVANGFRRFLFCVGHNSKPVKDYFKDGKWICDDVDIAYSDEGEVLLGTAGAIVNALSFLDDSFMVIYGDSFMDIDYKEAVYRFLLGKDKGKKALMTVMENGDFFDKSNVEYMDGEIIRYSKKEKSSQMTYIDYGVSVFSKTVFERLERGKKIDLSDVQSKLVDMALMSSYEVVHRFYEIGTPKSLKEFQLYAKHRFDEKHPAVFFDRDGVINEIVYIDETQQLDSPMSPKQFHMFPEAKDALKSLKDAGYYIFVVTNQPAAAKGKTSLETLYSINTLMCRQLRDVMIDGVEICPHHPTGSEKAKDKSLIRMCECRKPNDGMIRNILKKFNIDVSRSYMVGDSYTDMKAGHKSGLKTIFIGNFKCDVCAMLDHNRPDLIVGGIKEASRAILQRHDASME